MSYRVGMMRPTVNAAPFEIILHFNGTRIHHEASIKDWWVIESAIGKVVSPVEHIGGSKEGDYEGDDLAAYAKT